ncbi:GEVED domain-containing protein [uncultured Draconibacterium sp.]|uniref:GEVED domain-containing protein n=1 Tax=uncultured Draconibacterium sp. TaxID=1573823 RepID=UPI00325FF632
MFSKQVVAQTTIWSEDFESYSDNTGIDGTGNIGDYPGSVTKWTIDASDCTLSDNGDFLKVNSGFFQGKDLDGVGIWQSIAIDITSFSNITVAADIWQESGNMEVSDYIYFDYRIDGGLWAEIQHLNNDINSSPQTFSVTGLNGSTLELRFEIYNNQGQENYAFDNIVVQGTATTPPSCTTPISPTNGETSFAVDGSLTWNAAPGATSYYLYFGTDAGATNIENGTDLGNVTSYTPSSDLDFLTDYYWRIVPYNANGNANGCAIWSFATGDVSYCEPSVSNNLRYIDRVRLGSIDNSSAGTGFSGGGFGDFTVLSTDLVQGETGVSLTVDVFSNTSYGIHVWVDWDQDGEFTQAGDNIVCDFGLDNNGNNQETYTFNVPSGAALGSTRLRVRLIYNETSCANPCLDFDYGEVEDYSLNITAACNVTVQNVTGGGSYCSGGAGVVVGLDDSESGVDYELYLDGSPTGDVVSGTGSAISFGNQTVAGTYTVNGHNVSEDCDLLMSGQADVTILTVPPTTANPSPANAATNVCYAGDGAISSVSWDVVADATSYDVYFGAGSLPGSVTANVATNSYSTGTLAANTTYYWKVVPKNACGDATGESTWTFTTGSSSCYCSATSTEFNLYESITNVTFAGINNNSPVSKTSGYTDYTGTVTPAEVILGQDYAVSVANEFLADEYGGYCKVYIDLDQDGTFDEGTELMYESGYTGNSTMSGTISIPLTASVGLTTMRIVLQGDADDTGALPCGDFQWGEVEDYAVNVSSPCTPADVPVLSAASTTVCPGSDVTITISGDLNDASDWVFYTGSCGGTQDGTTATNSYTVNNLTTTTTFYARGEGSSCDDPTCGSITITVEDVEDPIPDIATLPDITAECEVTTLTAPTATDNCAGTVTGTTTTTLPITTQGTTVVTWTYDDGNGNTSTQTQNVVIDDVTDPTITCPADVNESVDAGSCVATGVTLGSPVSSDNCGVGIINNNAPASYPLGTTIVTWTVTDIAGNTATCNQNVTIVPEEDIDVEVQDLGNSCQSGETGSTTTVTWNITKLSGTDDWTFDYEITEGATVVASGNNVGANGNTKVSFDADNETAQSKTYTLTITNVRDACGVNEINTTNNSDSVTLDGVPDTSDINTN